MVELKIVVSEPCVEGLSDVLLEKLNALSISIEDAQANTLAEQELFGEPGMEQTPCWTHSLLKVLFQTHAQAQVACEFLKAEPAYLSGLSLVGSIDDVPNQDWVRLTQSQFSPVEITPDFWIVPSWHESPKQARYLIQLDPGLAFGTGTHPTTRMCLQWIAHYGSVSSQSKPIINQIKEHTQPSSHNQSPLGRVLDYGCGSGILAIAAALYGAQEVIAVDIDEQALEATQINAKQNKVHIQTGLPNIAQGQFDVVVANIVAAPLKMLAEVLCHFLKPGAYLVLSGILTRQVSELQLRFAREIRLEVWHEDEGWVLLTGQYLPL